MEREASIDIERLFEPGAEPALRSYISLLHPADVAELFKFVESERWLQITSLLSPEHLGEVLTHVDERYLESLTELLRPERLVEAVEELETDDAADLLQEMDQGRARDVLAKLDEDDRTELNTLLAYPDDSAGGLMQTEVCSVEYSLTVRHAIEAVRECVQLVDDVHAVYLVDDGGVLTGVVGLEALVLASEETPLSQLSESVEKILTADLDQEEVARVFRKYDVAILPVVTQEGVLVGRITFDDIHDVIVEEATEDVMAMAGASGDGEDLVYTNQVGKITLFRLPWLISSLLGALITTQLIPLFSSVPGDTIVLASFVPVVMAMTGNMGSQTAMIITRGFAIGKVEMSNVTKSLIRETTVGLLMGISAGIVVFIFTFLVYDNLRLGIAVGASMVASMASAATAGTLAPTAFKKLGVDPAIAAGPFVTTVCDVLGVAAYLLVAILVLRGG